MALREIPKDTINIQEQDGVLLVLNNGDLGAVDEAKRKWNFKKREDVLRYALAVIAQLETPIVYINKGDLKVGLTPSKELIEEKGERIESVGTDSKTV
jgi:hypothetical protein